MNLFTSTSAKVGVAAFALLSVALFWLLLGSFGGPTIHTSAPLRKHVVLDDAGGIPQHADVLVHGVKVGVVSRVSTSGAQTRLDLQLAKDEVPPLHADATVRVAAKTPLGESFVDLDPGRAPGAAPTRLRARPAVEVDEALRALDPSARRDVRALLHTGGRALRSGAAARRVAASLDGLDVTVMRLQQLGVALDGQEPAITATIRDADTVIGALAERSADVRGTVAAAARTLAATGAQRTALEAAVRELPGLEREATATLGAARPLLREALPVVRDVDAASPALSAALRDLPAALTDLDTLLARAPALRAAALPTLDVLRRLAPAALPAVQRLGPTLANVVPMLNFLGDRRQTIAAWFSNTDDLGSNGDAKGKWARFFIMLDPATAFSVKAGAPPGNSYTRPGDATHNAAYRLGDFPRLLPYAPALGR